MQEPKITKAKYGWNEAKVVECLPTKFEAEFKPQYQKKRKKKRKMLILFSLFFSCYL
jgi:hypothetical protein